MGQHYSQNNEQEVISEVFGDFVGGFLDIGACDGRLNSNTLALVEKGWSGVLVEPSPRAFVKLQELHGANPKLVLIHAAVSLSHDLAPFWDGPSALGYSTTEEGNRIKWDHLCAFENQFWMPTLPLMDLMPFVMGLGYLSSFDLLSLDTEGTSVQLFQSFPFSMVKPRVVCVEHDGLIPDCQAVADRYGYREIARNAENLIYVRNE